MEPYIESDVKEFAERLPPVTVDDAHLLMLASRSRFTKALIGRKGSDFVVERKIIRSRDNWRDIWFNRFVNLVALQQHGTYYLNEGMLPIPHQAMAVFATVNPRNVARAVSEIMKYSSELLYQAAANPSDRTAREQLARIDHKFFSLLHANRSRSSPKLVTVDIDEPDYYRDIKDAVSCMDTWMISKTSRGYHIVLNMSKSDAASDFYRGGGIWPRILEKYPDGVELQSDPQEPVPGSLYMRVGQDSPNYVTIVE